MMICIEGVDASGKATHSRKLANSLNAKLFSFPDYSTQMGHLILGHLKRYWQATPADTVPVGVTVGKVEAVNALVFQALQTVNRLERAPDLVKAVSEGNVVLDRYWPSGWVYGVSDGLDGDWLLKVHASLPQPDLFILLDIDEKHSIERRPERRDRYEQQAGLTTRASVQYRRLWDQMGKLQGHRRWRIVDARGTKEETEAKIYRVAHEAAGAA